MRALLLALLATLTLAAPAAADYEYVAGQETTGPTDGVCPGIGILAKAAYYNNAAGQAPRADEAFFVELRLTYFESFDCAAAFTGITMTLPNGLALDATGAKRVACQRFDLGDAADPRMTANCPSVPPNLGGSTFSLDPVATNFPEREAFGRKFWFQGYDGAGTYRTMRVLVPVKAAGALSNAPVTFQMKRFDAATPWTASVGVTTTGATPPNGGTFKAPVLSVQNGPGSFQVSPIGVQVPFSVVKGSGSYGVSEKVVLGTCAQNPCEKSNYEPPGNANCTESLYPQDTFTTDESFLDVFGDFGDPLGISPACDLKPETQFTLELCQGYNNASMALTVNCEHTTFTTPPVALGIDVTDSGTTSASTTFAGSVRGAWPAGAARLEIKRPGQSFSTIASYPTIFRGTGTQNLSGVALDDLASWQEHQVRACFTPTGGAMNCSVTKTFVPGALEAQAPATGSDTATFGQVKLRAPTPALTVQLRLRKASEATTQDVTQLPVVGTATVAASGSPGTITVPDIVAAGLDPATRYAWTVCVEADGDAAPEDCTPGGGFTTALAPVATVTAEPSVVPTATATAPPTATPDTTKPAVKLAVKGKRKRRRKITLTVTATDAGGIRSVTIKAGRKKPFAGSRLVVRLPRRKGRFKIVVTVEDNAGNRSVLTRTLRVR